MIIFYELTETQHQLIKDRTRFICVAAGRRSRKTLIGKYKIYKTAILNDNKRYFMGAPVRSQAKEIFWNDLKDNMKLFISEKPNETELKVKLINGTQIYIEGLDRPDRIEGRPWNGCLITEMASLKPEAWSRSIRPALSDTRGFAILEGKPMGSNHWAEMCIRAAGGVLPEVKPGGVSAHNKDWAFYSWHSADVLSADEIEAAKEDLDEMTFREQYEASFESHEGLFCFSFSRDNIKNLDQMKTDIVIANDFNVNPFAALVIQDDGANVYVREEIKLKNFTTEMFLQYVGSNILPKYKTKSPIFYPDPTGKARSTKSLISDIAIIKNKYVVKTAKDVSFNNRSLCLNRMFRNANGKCRIFINPRCKELIKDCETVERKPDGSMDKKDINRTHWLDALGNYITKEYPIRTISVPIYA